MSGLLLVLQIIISIILSGLILLQAKGVGLGRSFGSAAYHSRRGLENVVFKATVVLAVLFTVLSITIQFLS